MKKKIIYVISAGVIGCGFCCLPLLLPIIVGITGVSVFSLLFTKYSLGIIFLLLAAILIVIYRVKSNKKFCELPTSKDDEIVKNEKL